MKKGPLKKKKKLDSIPKIKRRLMKLWSEAVRHRDGHQCIYCGIKAGDINKNGKIVKCDAHHCQTREAKNSPLKYDIRNGITLCPSHHKFSNELSAHKCPITFYKWLSENYPDQYNFVLENSSITVDLENRKVLENIESKLKEHLHLDFNKLKEIESQFPRAVKKKKTEIKGSLFDEDGDGEKNSSSSSD